MWTSYCGGQATACGISGGQVTQGQIFFFRVIRFFPVTVNLPMLPTRIYHRR